MLDIWALWRGAEISGTGTATLTADVVMISAAASRLAIPIEDLDGAHMDLGAAEIVPTDQSSSEAASTRRGAAPARLTLFHRSGDVVEIGGADTVTLGREIVSHACDIPELTVPLRALGSARARPGVDHDRFFGPFLAARRAAARASDPEQRLSSVDSRALAASVGATVRELAADRYPKQPAERRAMEAELADLAQPVVASLERLAAAADSARTAPDDARFVRWREWAGAYRDVFRAADQCWLAAIGSALGPRAAHKRDRFGWRR
jgi:hypothetical protein